MSRDHFGREIIRLFNEMAGFRDSPEVNSAGLQIKYIDTQTDAPTAEDLEINMRDMVIVIHPLILVDLGLIETVWLQQINL